MRASVIATRFNVERIIHHTFYPSGSTMVRLPYLHFVKRPHNTKRRQELASVIRQLRAINGIPKGWTRLPVSFPYVSLNLLG